MRGGALGAFLRIWDPVSKEGVTPSDSDILFPFEKYLFFILGQTKDPILPYKDASEIENIHRPIWFRSTSAGIIKSSTTSGCVHDAAVSSTQLTRRNELLRNSMAMKYKRDAGVSMKSGCLHDDPDDAS